MFCLFLQESLRKITHTLALKNEEISNFVSTLKQSLDNLEVRSAKFNPGSARLFLSILTPHFLYLLVFMTPGGLQQSPGGPGVWVYLPPVCPGRDEGKHDDTHQTGESQPHLWAAGRCCHVYFCFKPGNIALVFTSLVKDCLYTIRAPTFRKNLVYL